MAYIGAVELLVTPEQLNQKAVEVERNVANMRNRFENMRTLVEKSMGYWVGRPEISTERITETRKTILTRFCGVCPSIRQTCGRLPRPTHRWN